MAAAAAYCVRPRMLPLIIRDDELIFFVPIPSSIDRFAEVGSVKIVGFNKRHITEYYLRKW